MDPSEALSTDESMFQSELDLLLSAPLSSESSRTTTTSPPHKRRSAEENNGPVKRLKADSQVEICAGNHNVSSVHPSRRHLLNLSDAPANYQAPSRLIHSGKQSSHGNKTLDGTTKDVAGSVTVSQTRKGGSVQHQTWRNLKNTVARQWDPRKHDLDYEFLVEQRRREKLTNVDRYVPTVLPKANNTPKRRSTFPLQPLPEDLIARIFEYLLVSKEPVTIDFYWLRSFIRGHARVPNVMQSAEVSGSNFEFPMDWSTLLADVQTMKDEMAHFKKALELRDAKTRASRSPCRGLSTSLLRVSRKIHKVAAQVFYSKNTFRFPCATSAWIQLDSFLATIGLQNAGNIQHLHIHPPMWYRLIQEGFVEGAMIDSLSPATRMAVIKPPARDRLLSAVQNAVHLFSPNLTTLVLELQDGMVDRWTGRYIDNKRMIAACDAEEHVYRKATGVALLNNLSKALRGRGKRPESGVCHLHVPRDSIIIRELQKRFPGMMSESYKYGRSIYTGLE